MVLEDSVHTARQRFNPDGGLMQNLKEVA